MNFAIPWRGITPYRLSTSVFANVNRATVETLARFDAGFLLGRYILILSALGFVAE